MQIKIKRQTFQTRNKGKKDEIWNHIKPPAKVEIPPKRKKMKQQQPKKKKNKQTNQKNEIK